MRRGGAERLSIGPVRTHLVIVSLLAFFVASCANESADLSFRDQLGTAEEPVPDESLHEVRIHEPPELTTISTSEGGVGTLCVTCHSLDGLGAEVPTSAADLGGPHAGLHFDHGSNTCSSCHNPEDITQLRLANGVSLPMRETMTLCAQCHGSQFRDYQHGAHGGMRGYWDRTRGPRERNHCIDCHDPHAPRYPIYMPMPPPADRVPPVRPHPEARHE